MVSWRWLVASGLMSFSLTGCMGEKSPDELATEVEPSVVLITYGDTKGHGTGFFVEGGKGACTVLTAAHVATPSSKLQVTTDDQKLWEVRKIQQLPNVDLALLTFQPENSHNCPYKPLRLGDSEKIKRGQRILLSGYPEREGETVLVNQFPEGRVTTIQKPPLPEGYAISYDSTAVSGMSGSPVVNAVGEVIAVHGKTDAELVSLARNQQSSLSPQQKTQVEEMTNRVQTMARINHFKWGIPIKVYLANTFQFAEVPFANSSVTQNSTLQSKDVPQILVSSISEIRDVQLSDRFFQQLQSLIERYGIIRVYSDKTFRPKQAITKSEFIDWLGSSLETVSQLKNSASKPSCRFRNLPSRRFTLPRDIEPDAWYYMNYRRIAEASGESFVNFDGNFEDNRALTKAEVVVLLNRTLDAFTESLQVISKLNHPSNLDFNGSLATSDRKQLRLVNLPNFHTELLAQVTSVSQLSDVRPTDWYFKDVQSLSERYGCLAGYPDGTFRANRKISRAESAEILNACLDRLNELIAVATANCP